ncbi:MAG: hypothetical protein E7265_07540 [Lachnospiraceae bacterium]|nr:hypothetical protein [Lachnospiraceae bacterium]
MGRLILCAADVAKEPYTMPVSGVKVYSIEELCYYLYQNIYEITPDYFDEKLVLWLNHQLGMKVIAEKLETLLEIDGSLKDIVISILCSCDYYSEDEIKALLGVLTEIEHLPYHGKQKQKADMYLRYGRYVLAKKEYDKLLGSGYSVNLTPTEYGNILHNRAMASFFLGMYEEALIDMKDAYARNNDSRTLQQYLYALLLCGRKDEFQKEVLNYQIGSNVAEGILELYGNAKERAMESNGYQEISKLRKYATNEEIAEYAAKHIEMWKRLYREGTY